MKTMFKVGDILKYSPYCNHIRRLRDLTMAGGKPSEVSRAKQVLQAERDLRFVVLKSYNNGFCDAVQYQIKGTETTGNCMASQLELAESQPDSDQIGAAGMELACGIE